jgi:hypothetical protein
MHLIINRGILVTAAQILLLVTFFGTPNHLYWMAVHINTTKLYVNTFCQSLRPQPSNFGCPLKPCWVWQLGC